MISTIKINSEKCKGCSLCFSKQFNKAGYHWASLEKENACIGCGFCYMVCPDVCIEVYKDL